MGAALAALLAMIVMAFAVGRYPVPLADLLRILWSWAGGAPHGLDSTLETVVLQIRGPRVMAAVLVGAALAAAGAAYQNLFRNPLVSPDILGVSAGSAVGAVLGIFLSQPGVVIQALAFVGGLAAGRKLMDSIKIFTLAVSLGCVDSLIQHPASMTHSTYTQEERTHHGISEGLVRLSIGLETPEDIAADLMQALAAV